MSESPYTPPKARIDPPSPSSGPGLERPIEVLFAIWLLIAGYLFGWVGVLVTWDYQMSLQAPAQFFLSQAFGAAIAVWIYYKIYHGRNWARILFLISVLLGLAAFLIPVFIEILIAAPPFTKLVMISGHLINVAVVWLLFFSPGRHWFNKRMRRGLT